LRIADCRFQIADWEGRERKGAKGQRRGEGLRDFRFEISDCRWGRAGTQRRGDAARPTRREAQRRTQLQSTDRGQRAADQEPRQGAKGRAIARNRLGRFWGPFRTPHLRSSISCDCPGAKGRTGEGDEDRTANTEHSTSNAQERTYDRPRTRHGGPRAGRLRIGEGNGNSVNHGTGWGTWRQRRARRRPLKIADSRLDAARTQKQSGAETQRRKDAARPTGCAAQRKAQLQGAECEVVNGHMVLRLRSGARETMPLRFLVRKERLRHVKGGLCIGKGISW